MLRRSARVSVYLFGIGSIVYIEIELELIKCKHKTFSSFFFHFIPKLIRLLCSQLFVVLPLPHITHTGTVAVAWHPISTYLFNSMCDDDECDTDMCECMCAEAKRRLTMGFCCLCICLWIHFATGCVCWWWRWHKHSDTRLCQFPLQMFTLDRSLNSICCAHWHLMYDVLLLSVFYLNGHSGSGGNVSNQVPANAMICVNDESGYILCEMCKYDCWVYVRDPCNWIQ